MMIKLAVIISFHNRRNKTIECLNRLYKQYGTKVLFELDVFCVDDASTDGTSIEILERFPDVLITYGSGDLYWNRGMHLAWLQAANHDDYDYYIWLNDDTMLFSDALVSFLDFGEKASSIIVGATCECEQTRQLTYGGYNQKSELIQPTGQFVECEFFNGNFVIVSRNVFKRLGMLDPFFTHALGDFDYGLRAKKMGIPIYLLPNFVGVCPSHKLKPIWRNEDLKIGIRINHLYSPLSGCIPKEYFYFDMRHFGLRKAILHFWTIHLRCFLPKLWNH